MWPDAFVASEISAHGLVRNPGNSRNVVDRGGARRVHGARGIKRLGTGSCAHGDLLQSDASAPARGPGCRQPAFKKLLDKTMFSTTLWLPTNVVDNIRKLIHPPDALQRSTHQMYFRCHLTPRPAQRRVRRRARSTPNGRGPLRAARSKSILHPLVRTTGFCNPSRSQEESQ